MDKSVLATDDELLDALEEARESDTEERMKDIVLILIARGVYPKETVEGNPNDVYAMVCGYGARWHLWSEPLACPHCNADLRDMRTGPPYKREVSHIVQDHHTHWSCPDCKRRFQ